MMKASQYSKIIVLESTEAIAVGVEGSYSILGVSDIVELVRQSGKTGRSKASLSKDERSFVSRITHLSRAVSKGSWVTGLPFKNLSVYLSKTNELVGRLIGSPVVYRPVVQEKLDFLKNQMQDNEVACAARAWEDVLTRHRKKNNATIRTKTKG